MPSPRRPVAIFAALCLVCALSLGAYFYRIATHSSPAPKGTRLTSDAPSLPATSSGDAPTHILFRYTGVDDNYGKLAIVDYPRLGAPRFVETPRCEVVHYAAGRGICLTADRGMFTTYAAQLFDGNFASTQKLPLEGGPSRTRVSRDGKLAGLTVFLTGHGYASVDFTTQTLIIDTASAQVLASLEDFAVTRDGQPFKAQDFNFWGVTFTPDSSGFYCTLSTNQTHLLVKGDLAARTATVLHENVECPSVSPDGTRIAYKKRFIIEGRLLWQLDILNLATDAETALAEKRSIDDQLEWLNNDEVLYSVSDNPDPGGSSPTTNVWKAHADGQGTPGIFIPKAYSPAVVR